MAAAAAGLVLPVGLAEASRVLRPGGTLLRAWHSATSGSPIRRPLTRSERWWSGLVDAVRDEFGDARRHELRYLTVCTAMASPADEPACGTATPRVSCGARCIAAADPGGSEAAEVQAVADDDRRERHGCAGEHRAKQPAGHERQERADDNADGQVGDIGQRHAPG
ncbi:hypothetical protein GCM10010170_074520 [Dactylosporangium salmoneum]|uniref:Methyltransferase type 11 domain-containing protein n=1 Tax=Dactylosporangium salmoneum TaxID=53361 RepID=A0ABP5U831_9ACTN